MLLHTFSMCVCVLIKITKQIPPLTHTHTLLFTVVVNLCTGVWLNVFGDISDRSQRRGVNTCSRPEGFFFTSCLGSKAGPAGDWVIKWAGLFSQPQLACCHLLTFRSGNSISVCSNMTHLHTHTHYYTSIFVGTSTDKMDGWMPLFSCCWGKM